MALINKKEPDCLRKILKGGMHFEVECFSSKKLKSWIKQLHCIYNWLEKRIWKIKYNLYAKKKNVFSLFYLQICISSFQYLSNQVYLWFIWYFISIFTFSNKLQVVKYQFIRLTEIPFYNLKNPIDLDEYWKDIHLIVKTTISVLRQVSQVFGLRKHTGFI